MYTVKSFSPNKFHEEYSIEKPESDQLRRQGFLRLQVDRRRREHVVRIRSIPSGSPPKPYRTRVRSPYGNILREVFHISGSKKLFYYI